MIMLAYWQNNTYDSAGDMLEHKAVHRFRRQQCY